MAKPETVVKGDVDALYVLVTYTTDNRPVIHGQPTIERYMKARVNKLKRHNLGQNAWQNGIAPEKPILFTVYRLVGRWQEHEFPDPKQKVLF